MLANPDGPDAAATITALRELTALRQRVVEVVGPFATRVPLSMLTEEHIPNDFIVARTGMPVGHFRAARTLANEIKEALDGK